MERYTVKQNETLQSSSINFDLPIGEDYTANLRQAELFNSSYLERVKEENINSIIDYEKQIFYPVVKHVDNEKKTTTIYDVAKINFNIYMRTREADENGDYDNWDVEEGGYWNLGIPGSGETPNELYGYGDLLGYLGFTDDDIKYQKNVLKKTFIRISVYDTPYRQTQKLLYYSTLFFDSNVIYKKYTNLCATPGLASDKVYVVPSDEVPSTSCLTARFTCTPKHNNEASSDGFYLYLFSTAAQKDENGKNPILYMKVEFNHAKYGKTIPLIWPHYHEDKIRLNTRQLEARQGDEISFYTDDFPTDYETEGINGNSYVDMSKLYGDLYIPIEVSYNAVDNRYEWQIISRANNFMRGKNGCNEDVININLFEPRINRLKQVPNGQNT